MLIIPQARRATIIPTTPQITAERAFVSFSESPKAVRNIRPAATKETTAINVNATQTIFKNPIRRLENVMLVGPVIHWAFAIRGRDTKPDVIMYKIIFFVLFICNFSPAPPSGAGIFYKITLLMLL